MKVTVVCFGPLRDYLPEHAEGNRALVDVPDGDDVAAVVEALSAPPGAVFAVLVNGERALLSTELRAGEEVTLMPPFSGGASRPRS